MKIACVIVNYRTAELTARAVASALVELPAVGSHHVLVVENDSQDGSLEALTASAERAGWGDRVTVLASPHNGGYGYGINVAVRHALAWADPPDYFFVLNPDAVLDPGSVSRIVALLDRRPEVGIAGNLVRGEDGTAQAGGFRFPTVLGTLESMASIGPLSRLLRRYVVPIPPSEETRDVDWVSGASMTIRRRVFEQVGLFDEGFFLYFEELDLCRRARDAGFAICFVGGAPVTHRGSASTGVADGTRRMPRYWFDSRHRYLGKHHGRLYTAAADGAWVAGYLLARTRRTLLREPQGRKPRLLGDFVAASLRDLARAGLPGDERVTSRDPP